jgi:hypothetical protein
VGVAGEADGVRRVSFGFRAEASTLPLEAAFPLLVRNALLWLARSEPPPPYVVAGETLPGGDGTVAPMPPPGGPYAIRLPDGRDSVVRWIPSPALRLSDASPRAVSPDRAVAAIPERAGDRDTRERHGPALALLGAVTLALGAFLLAWSPSPSARAAAESALAAAPR